MLLLETRGMSIGYERGHVLTRCFVDIQTREARYINPKATVTLFGINPPSLRSLPVRFPCDQAPLLNAVVAGTKHLIGAPTPNHLPARDPLCVTAVANAHAHHTQVMRSPVHARNTNSMSFIQHQSFNLTTRVGSSVLKRTRKSLKSTHVSRISPSALLMCAFVDPNRNLRSTGYKTRAGFTDVILTCGVTSMPCSMMASPETQILVTVTTHQCKFTAHTLLH